jgi:hypothetical protein
MKSKEWAKKFNKDDVEGFCKAYARETEELVNNRTRGSGMFERGDKKWDTTPAATEGALREQRQKWTALCRLVNEPELLTVNLFDDKVVKELMPETAALLKKWTDAKAKENSKTIENSPGKIGRRLVS